MFTFPNAPYTGEQHLPVLERMMKHSGVKPSARERRGLKNEVVREAQNTAVLMSAHHAVNPPETEGSTWCIATDRPASFALAWDGSGDGSALWREFEQQGRLTEQQPSAPSEIPCGALCVEIEVGPGSEATVPFALAWDFPRVEFSPGTRWWRRYTEYFPPQPGQAFAIAREALAHWQDWRKAIEEWQDPIVSSPAYPDWLKQGALNELYYATFGGSFWENGCITKPKKFGNRSGQHLAFVMECQEYRFAESFDVRHHPARSNRDLWPRNERDLLLLFCDFIMDTPDGSCPHDAGGVDNDPLFLYDGYGRYYNNTPQGIKGRITTPWSELSPKFILQSYAYWHKTRDDAFLDVVWPALVRSFNYQKTTDTNGDGLSEMKSSEYLDNKMFNAVLWLGALEALQAFAEHKHEDAFCKQVSEELRRARASTEEQFWNEQLGYYQYNQHNQDMMGDAMIGERYVDVTGLPPLLDPNRLTSHYHQLFRRAVLPLKDLNSDGVGDMGVANAVHPDSTPGVGDSEYTHQFEVWTGVSYCAAANVYHWGKRIGDGSLQADALLAAWGVYYETWQNESTAYWFSTPEAWRLENPAKSRALMYQRARGIWELTMEVWDPWGQTGS
jgi:non-lysosomal glucosylceramidase